MTDADRAALREALANLSRYHAWAKGGPVEWAGPVPSTPPPAGQLWVWVSSLLDALDRAEAELEQAFREGCWHGRASQPSDTLEDLVAAWRERRGKV